MANSMPIFREENLAYKREEGDGYLTIIPKYHPETRELMINLTAAQILNLCNGGRNLEEIEKEMHTLYPLVPADSIKKDVLSTVAKFSRMAVVEWKGENPFIDEKEEPISDLYSMVVGQEADILKIHSFVLASDVLSNSKGTKTKNYFMYHDPYIRASDYSEITLRFKLFNYIEEFFLLTSKGEICGLICIAPSMYGCTAGTIKLIIVPKDYFVDLISYSEDNLPRIAIVPISKVKIVESGRARIDRELKECLLKHGYKTEAVLKNEFGFGGHLVLFSHIYEQAFIERLEQHGEVT